MFVVKLFKMTDNLKRGLQAWIEVRHQSFWRLQVPTIFYLQKNEWYVQRSVSKKNCKWAFCIKTNYSFKEKVPDAALIKDSYTWQYTFARPCEGIHRRTSPMSLSLPLQQFPASLVHLTWIALVMGGWWPYSWCFVGCCLQDLCNIVCSILVYLPLSFFSTRLVNAHVVYP